MFSRLKLGFWIATILALACTLAYAVCHTRTWSARLDQDRRVLFPADLAPDHRGGADLADLINDLQRRVARYREMQIVLEESRKRVAFCQTWNSLERIVLKTERALLQEVIEWHSLTSFAESH